MRVLVVDQGFHPLNDIPLQRAVHLLCRYYRDDLGMLRPVAEPVYNPKHSREEQSFTLRLVQGVMLVPKVIRIIKEIRRVYKAGIMHTKRNVFIRDRMECVYCGDSNRLTVDHVIPVARGGKDTWENTVAACFDCNQKKGCKTPNEAGMKMRLRPYQPTVAEFLHLRLDQVGLTAVLKELFR